MTSKDETACDACILAPVLRGGTRRDFLRGMSAMALVLVTPLHETDDERTYAIPASDGAQLDKKNDTIVARVQDKVYVFSLACPHQSTELRWMEKDHEFYCPKHKSRYLADGIYVKDSGRATRGLDRFAVRKDGNNIVANLDKLYQEDEHEAWKTAFITA